MVPHGTRPCQSRNLRCLNILCASLLTKVSANQCHLPNYPLARSSANWMTSSRYSSSNAFKTHAPSFRLGYRREPAHSS
ncbi:hypothetical protein EV363DRAFT_1312636 [Boletus edulis]|uniref:Secreted protein n=1 Tax=Boletus edulis BED1 TaxID=1328754 RepID=A0AAD4G485_BOLED|nr:hypothetical protein EV363DRAFT_1312636 [Boletus edulis]KAF8414439.1 hypothetical protein L210DRAFT_3592814 [Boletus edulis BED1]